MSAQETDKNTKRIREQNYMVKIAFKCWQHRIRENVLGDIMLTPALRDAEIALTIDPERLEESYIMVTSSTKTSTRDALP